MPDSRAMMQKIMSKKGTRAARMAAVKAEGKRNSRVTIGKVAREIPGEIKKRAVNYLKGGTISAATRAVKPIKYKRK